MLVESFGSTELMAARAVDEIVSQAHSAIASKNRFTLAISGGSTPKRMLELLATRSDMPWSRTSLFQVDERIAPFANSDRNRTMQSRALFESTMLKEQDLNGVHWMPVDDLDPNDQVSLAAAAEQYAQNIHDVCSSNGALDVIQLGMGDDGHTASLVPGDAVCDVLDRDIAITHFYKGRRRMTLTFPALNSARMRLWTIGGLDKAGALNRLLAQDPTIPAGRVEQRESLLLASPNEILFRHIAF